MSSDTFEHFCLDVARQSTVGVENADLYERKGLKQFGGDFYLDRGEAGLVVGSCKAHEKPQKKDIVGKDGAQKFIDHWESHWRPAGVTKFVLCLAADARDHVRLDHIRATKKNIRALGIECEVWAQKELVDRCRRHEGIVRQYLGAAWVYRLCAYLQPFASAKEQNLIDGLYAERDDLRSTQNPLLDEALRNLQRLMRQERYPEALQLADGLRQNYALWRTAEPKQRARILRTQAACCIEADLDRAKDLYTEATSDDPPTDRYFDALLELRFNGNEAARDLLSEPRNGRERRLKAALLIEDGQPEPALSLLEEDESQSETIENSDEADRHRLKAIACLMLGDARNAILFSKAAIHLDGDLFGARLVLAVSYYACTLSPATKWPGLDWPTPYPLVFVKADEQSIQHRAFALHEFDKLISSMVDVKRRAALNVWKFAHLLDNHEKHDDAANYLDGSYKCGLFHPALVMWALARRLKFNKTKARRALEKIVAEGLEAPEHVAALLGLYVDLKRYDDAQQLFEGKGDSLSVYGRTVLQTWQYEIARGLKRDENVSIKPAALERGLSLEQITAVLVDVEKSPLDRFEAASLLAEEGEWEAILENSEFLLDEIGTKHAFRLVVLASANLDRPTEALAMLETRAMEFCGKADPPEFSRIRVQLRARSGDIPGALQEAQRLLSDPKDENYLLRAQIEAQSGDFVAAGRVVADAVGAGNPELNDPRELIRWATILRDDDPRRAASLLRRAKEVGLGDTIGQATALALSLIPKEAAPYVEDLRKSASRTSGATTRALAYEEFRELMIHNAQQAQHHRNVYDNGDVPGHMIFGTRLGLAYLGPFEDLDEKPSHGARVAHAVGRVNTQFIPTSLAMDTTAILLAEGLNLWPRLRSSELDLILPHNWSLTFLAMEHAASPGQPDRAHAHEVVVDLVVRKRIKMVGQRPAGSLAVDLDGDEGTGDWLVSQVTTKLSVEGDPEQKWEELRERTIFLRAGAAVQLQLDDSLRKLCDIARVCIDHDHFEAIRRQRSSDETGASVAARIRNLRRDLSDHVRSGRLRVAPEVALPAEFEQRDNPVETTLWSVLHHTPSEGLALWIDDRFINGHSDFNNIPVLGIRSVIDLIAGQQAPEILTAFRRSRHTYILPTADEFAAALKAWLSDASLKSELDALHSSWTIFIAQHRAVLEKRDGPGILEHQAVRLLPEVYRPLTAKVAATEVASRP